MAFLYKFHGPKGIGFVYISETFKLILTKRWGQERNMRLELKTFMYALGSYGDDYENLEEETNYIKGLKIYD